MQNKRQTLQIPTSEGSKLEVEVNYSNHDKVKEGKMLRFRFNDEEFDVKTDDIVSILLSLGREEVNTKLLPVKHSKVKHVERLLTFEFNAKQDYKKGEKVVFQAPWIDTIVQEEETFNGSL